MANEPEDMIMPMLREMRGEMREMRSEMHEMKQQLDKLESGQKTIRQALTADTMMSKFVTGDFEERIFELERKVEALSKGK
jgi:predicted RNase H-like nuclease (RuvC/YqgF family)